MPRPTTWSTSGAEAVGVLALVDVPVAERASCRRRARGTSRRRGRSARRRPTAATSARRLQLGDVVVEVDRLPRVEQHRPRRARVTRPGAHVARGTASLMPSSPSAEYAASTAGAAYVSPGARRTSPGSRSSDSDEEAAAVGQRLDAQAVVAAPRRGARPTPRRSARRRPRVPTTMRRRRLVRGPAAAVLQHEGADVPSDRARLRLHLLGPAAGERQHLVGARAAAAARARARERAGRRRRRW